MTKEEIIQKHVQKYYYHKGRKLNDDDILPLSRIRPLMDEYATAQTAELQKEVERLKGIIYELWDSKIVFRKRFDFKGQWEKFKTENNL